MLTVVMRFLLPDFALAVELIKVLLSWDGRRWNARCDPDAVVAKFWDISSISLLAP